MVKVAKFGGSSVAGAQQFEKVKAIVEAVSYTHLTLPTICSV